MINEINVMKYCKDDITKIENYDKAINDKEHMWVIHHRLELTLDGDYAHSKEDLIRMNMYYARPYFELIFLTQAEHVRLHMKGKQPWNKGKTLSDDHRRKLSEAKKGKTLSDDHRRKLSEAKKANSPWKGKHLSDDTRRKISEAQKDKPRSEFGKKFKEHYHMTLCDNMKLYKREYNYYVRHGKCRWE